MVPEIIRGSSLYYQDVLIMLVTVFHVEMELLGFSVYFDIPVISIRDVGGRYQS